MRIVFVLLALLVTLAPAEARHYHHRHHTQRAFKSLYSPAEGFFERARGWVAQMLPHPAGCPATQFCACGAMHDLGLHDRSLWLASAWYRFPRSLPGHNTVAVRPHHVFVLKYQIRGSVWMVADYNSGGHASRLHPRDISGYTIVNPS